VLWKERLFAAQKQTPDINFHNANKDTALDIAASDVVDIIKLLLGKGMSVVLTNTLEGTPLHVSATWDTLEST
jgi:ankyrin repeat protein